MTRPALAMLIAALTVAAPRPARAWQAASGGAAPKDHAAAPESTEAASSKPAAPSHGIVRTPRPRSAEPVKVAPAASTEAVVAAIAAAVKSAEDAKKPAPAAARPRPTPRAPRPAAQKRYALTWPERRVEVKWETPEGRLALDWSEPATP